MSMGISTPSISSPLVDIGVNLGNSQFRHDPLAVIERAQSANVQQLIITGTSIDESQKIQHLWDELSPNHPNQLFCTAGIHPHDAKTFNSDSLAQLKQLAQHESVVALGEMGLDFNRNYSSPTEQIRAFEEQLNIATTLQLPVFLHERDAHEHQLAILREYRDKLTNGVIHCFTGDKKSLFNYLDLDLHIGITGWVCDDKRGAELQTVVANIPNERIMAETDAPFLLPKTIQPKPSSRRNEPCYLPWVIDKLAACRHQSATELAQYTTDNARRFFQLPDSE